VRVAAIVPAYNNERTIAETVAVLLSDPRIESVLVVDDASVDGTSAEARAAGAQVLRLQSNSGKGTALERGLGDMDGTDVILMVDGDTGKSALGAIELIGPVIDGDQDMVIGILPSAGGRGGFGTVKRIATMLIRMSAGFRSQAPLSGQRAMTKKLLDACRPFARGFGVDSALTADAVRAGFRVAEMPVDMTHDHRGRSVAGFGHRAIQGIHLLRAFLPRLRRGRTRHS